MSPILTLEIPGLATKASVVSRTRTPFQGKPVLSREFMLSQMVQAGIRAAAELEQLAQAKATGSFQGPVGAHTTGVDQCGASLPLELSPELRAALATLSQIRTGL